MAQDIGMTVVSHREAVDSAITQGAVAGLNLAAYEVQGDARKKAPKLTGTLERSMLIHQATPEGLEAAVYSTLHYIVYQHEIFSYRRSNGGPKFLERAALEYERAFRQQVAKTIRDHAA